MSAMPAEARASYEDPRVEALAWPELQRFESDGAFRDYVRDVRRMRRQLNDRRAEAGVPEIVVAQADAGQLECGADPLPPCPEEDAQVVVTGSRIATPSITNNQMAGVDEGDIVKRIGDH